MCFSSSDTFKQKNKVQINLEKSYNVLDNWPLSAAQFSLKCRINFLIFFRTRSEAPLVEKEEKNNYDEQCETFSTVNCSVAKVPWHIDIFKLVIFH